MRTRQRREERPGTQKDMTETPEHTNQPEENTQPIQDQTEPTQTHETSKPHTITQENKETPKSEATQEKRKTQREERDEKDAEAQRTIETMNKPTGKPLDSPRQELFCILYATPSELKTFGNAMQSYIHAGFKNTPAANGNSIRLIVKDKIKNRIDEIYAQYKEKTEITEERQRRRFEELSTKAQKKGDFSSAIRAEENLSKHIGFYKTDNEQIAGNVEDSPKPDEAIKRSQEKIRLANAG